MPLSAFPDDCDLADVDITPPVSATHRAESASLRRTQSAPGASTTSLMIDDVTDSTTLSPSLHDGVGRAIDKVSGLWYIKPHLTLTTNSIPPCLPA